MVGSREGPPNTSDHTIHCHTTVESTVEQTIDGRNPRRKAKRGRVCGKGMKWRREGGGSYSVVAIVRKKKHEEEEGEGGFRVKEEEEERSPLIPFPLQSSVPSDRPSLLLFPRPPKNSNKARRFLSLFLPFLSLSSRFPLLSSSSLVVSSPSSLACQRQSKRGLRML